MITRAIEEVKIYTLCLNPVTGCVEEIHRVAISTDYDALVKWYNEQKLDKPGHDHDDPVRNGCGGPIFKYFKKGSPLEYYNPCDSTDIVDTASGENVPTRGGVLEDWYRAESVYRAFDTGLGGCTIVCKD
ncbi:MAG: hypothetical protein K2N48_09510 [Muribaculaceae bacterium]|nr:hypothetical protein [Muribaculaceae bacterium]